MLFGTILVHAPKETIIGSCYDAEPICLHMTEPKVKLKMKSLKQNLSNLLCNKV